MMAEDDVENPASQVTEDPSAGGATRSKRRKILAGSLLLVVAVVVAVVLGVTLGKPKESGANATDAKSVDSDSKVEEGPDRDTDETTATDVSEETGEGLDSSNDGIDLIVPQVYRGAYLTSDGPIQAQIKVIDETVASGYTSCDDMKADLVNALKHYANKVIKEQSQATWYPWDECNPDDPTGCWWCGVPSDSWPSESPSASSSPTSSPRPSMTPSVSQRPSSSTRPSYPTAMPTSGSTPTVGYEMTAPPDSNYAQPAPAPGAGDGEDSYETNNQVDGVDEADIVKSDGDYVYAGYGDLLYVWNATQGTQGMSVTTMPAINTGGNCEPYRGRKLSSPINDDDYFGPGWKPTCPKPRILALLLEGSRLAVVVSESGYGFHYNYDEPRPIIDSSTKLSLRVYDVSDVPLDGPLTLVGERELVGGYEAARSVGETGFVITSTGIEKHHFGKLLYRTEPDYCGLNSTEYEELAAEIAISNVEAFANQMVNELQLQLDGTCRGIFQIAAMQSGNDTVVASTNGDILNRFVQVLSFDMSSDYTNKAIQMNQAAAFAPGWSSTVYASQTFVATTNSGSSYDDESGDWVESTFILGFNTTGMKPEPFSYAEVPGEPLNQYSIDLHDNHLRIVTTEWNWWSDIEPTNKIFVFKLPESKEEGSMMALVGESDKLGKPGETVYAARFIRDRAYIVTFENTDPFYIYDLSDPSEPTKLGELEIPGFSSYLHPVTIDGVPLMLGVGEQVNETTGWTEGTKISLFDITDPSELKENATYVDFGAYSSAGSDFKSFRFLAESQKLILHKSKYTYSDKGNFDGFVVYDVGLGDISPVFEIQHATSYDIYHGCWYSASMPARSFVFKSKLTTILSHSVISTDLANGDKLWNITLDEGLNNTDCSSYFY